MQRREKREREKKNDWVRSVYCTARNVKGKKEKTVCPMFPSTSCDRGIDGNEH